MIQIFRPTGILYLTLLIASCTAAVYPAQQSASNKSEPVQKGEESVLPGDWGPELLYGILNSPNPQASEELQRAAFAAGASIVPQLQAALKDDRTAEFAAQLLAYIGGQKALDILSKLVDDPRDLDLRRFYYGALGEFDDPRATDILLDVVRRPDPAADRTAIESAVIALTVRTDASLVPKLRDIEKSVKDVVVQDDIENAADVIEARGQYLATPSGKKAGGSIDQAIRTYFIPALEEQPRDSASMPQSDRDPGNAKKPEVEVRIENLTFSIDRNRALAHVVFETPAALANYEIVLQKKLGNWTLASVWLGAEMEKGGINPSALPHNPGS